MQHKLNALEIPNFVRSTAIIMRVMLYSGIMMRIKLNTQLIANERIRVILVPINSAIIPDKNVDTSSETAETITLVYISPGMYFM